MQKMLYSNKIALFSRRYVCTNNANKAYRQSMFIFGELGYNFGIIYQTIENKKELLQIQRILGYPSYNVNYLTTFINTF